MGVLLLGIPTAGLFVLGIAGGVLHAGSVAAGALVLLALCGLGIGLRFEWRYLRGRTGRTSVVDGAVNAVAILGGTLLTLAAAIELGLSPIVAAGLVGVLATITVPTRAVPVYCGAFVGMTSPVLFGTYFHAAIAAAIASVVFLASEPAFHGVGGKLGTTAFVGVTATVLAVSGAFQDAMLPDRLTIGLVLGYAVVGAVVTYALHTRTDRSPVFASGLIGALGGSFLPLIHGEYGGIMAAAVFSASFAGMTDPTRIPDERWIGLAGVLVGVLVVYTTPYLGGSGGKLGTIAFGSCLAVYAVLRTRSAVRARSRVTQFPQQDTT